MNDATVDMSLQESCRDAARHMSVEVALLAAKTDELLAENAKLRKILADARMYLCLVKMSGPLSVEIDEHNVYWDGEKILNRMLELRIEE